MSSELLAPELEVDRWLNASEPLSLNALRGRAVFLVAFQMLCPGCVREALPQAKRVREVFSGQQLAVIGIHSVFEHHAAQGRPEALAAFLHENHISFPVAIDAPVDGALPRTMSAYGMRGTPTLILIDRGGYLRINRFGYVDDLNLGAAIASVVCQA